MKLLAEEATQAVLEHRAVLFAEQIAAERNLERRPNAEMMAIECRMMQLAGSDSVGDPCFAEHLGVGDDVSGVEQVRMAEEADGAARSIGLQDGRAELALVQSLAHFDDSVLPFDDGGGAARDRLTARSLFASGAT
jgi:hypothetical protein